MPYACHEYDHVLKSIMLLFEYFTRLKDEKEHTARQRLRVALMVGSDLEAGSCGQPISSQQKGLHYGSLSEIFAGVSCYCQKQEG